MAPEHQWFSDPYFWSQAILLLMLAALYARQRLQERIFLVFVTGLKEQFRLTLESMQCEAKPKQGVEEYLSAQTDIAVHHGHELDRLRESAFELAVDLEHLATLQFVATHASFPGTDANRIITEIFGKASKNVGGLPTELALVNQVFLRHTQLPEEFPAETQADYRAGKWTCLFCETHIEHSWTLWCPNCHRRAFLLSDASMGSDKMRSAPEHESTQPGGLCADTVTCSACGEVFALTQHPLLATCPHCNARQ